MLGTKWLRELPNSECKQNLWCITAAGENWLTISSLAVKLNHSCWDWYALLLLLGLLKLFYNSLISFSFSSFLFPIPSFSLYFYLFSISPWHSWSTGAQWRQHDCAPRDRNPVSMQIHSAPTNLSHGEKGKKHINPIQMFQYPNISTPMGVWTLYININTSKDGGWEVRSISIQFCTHKTAKKCCVILKD